MEGERSSSPSRSSNGMREGQGLSMVLRMKKGCLYFATSLQKCFLYLKALSVGQAKKMTAKTEKEASEADLQTAKMQVEATDAAEDARKQLEEDKRK